MPDVSLAMQAKSDQLNALDIQGMELILKIRDVKATNGDQPVWIYYDGDHNRPWKPSKGMVRVLASAWGNQTESWISKSAKVFCDETVKYAGKEVGGIRVNALSDIPTNGINCFVTLNRTQRVKQHIEYLDTSRPSYPEDKFNAGFDKMLELMQNGSKTLQQIIAQCQKTGDLTEQQLARLQEVAPVDINENTEEVK